MKTMLAALLMAKLALMAAGCDLSAWLGSARLEKVEQAADEAETMAAEMQEIILPRIEKCIAQVCEFMALFNPSLWPLSDGDCLFLSEWAGAATWWLRDVDAFDLQLRRTDMAEAETSP